MSTSILAESQHIAWVVAQTIQAKGPWSRWSLSKKGEEQQQKVREVD